MLNKALSFGSTLIALSLCATLSSGVVLATPSAEVATKPQPTAQHQFPPPSLQSPTASGVSPAAAPTIAGCPLFPANNIWNAKVDWLPRDSRSDAYINSIGPNTELHADFGSGIYGDYGIPYTITTGAQISVTINFSPYGSESDPGPYPIPPNVHIEGGSSSTGDRHVLVVEKDNCKLYEMYKAYPQGNGSWNAQSGAVYNLNSNALRTDTWTSADAAGLPIFPGLARCDEILAGEINHALRFTADDTQKKHIWPARHDASSITDMNVPPMGQRFRLKSSFDISGFSSQAQVILTALKTYGMILADNGSDWYISGAPGSCWDDDTLVYDFDQVLGSNFEAVDESFLMLDPNSGQAFIFTPTEFLFMPLIRR